MASTTITSLKNTQGGWSAMIWHVATWADIYFTLPHKEAVLCCWSQPNMTFFPSCTSSHSGELFDSVHRFKNQTLLRAWSVIIRCSGSTQAVSSSDCRESAIRHHLRAHRSGRGVKGEDVSLDMNRCADVCSANVHDAGAWALEDGVVTCRFSGKINRTPRCKRAVYCASQINQTMTLMLVFFPSQSTSVCLMRRSSASLCKLWFPRKPLPGTSYKDGSVGVVLSVETLNQTSRILFFLQVDPFLSLECLIWEHINIKTLHTYSTATIWFIISSSLDGLIKRIS